jgi:hypothetical protein
MTALLALVATPAMAHENIAIPVRGHTVTVAYYRCAAGGTPKGTIIIGSGDVVGRPRVRARALGRGYVTVGINVRETRDVTWAPRGRDARRSRERLRDDCDDAARSRWCRRPTSGVSEGAAMAVLEAALSPGNHTWIRGVMTLGLPPTAEMAAPETRPPVYEERRRGAP